MLLEGVKPDNITLLAALTSCETSQALPAGKLIHGLIAQSGHQCDLILENALVSMYGSCGSVDDAKRVFDAMPARNVITWTAMIGAHAVTSLEQAFKVFRLMELEGFKSNFVTYVTLVQACSKPEFLEVGIILHMRSVESSSAMETPLCNALITMYGRCGRLEDARAIFSSMVERDIIAWNALITEYGQHGHVEEAVLLYQLMLQEGCKPDKVTFVALLTMSNGPEALTEVKLVHSHIVESGVSINIALGTALVAMYSKCESLEDTRWLFEKMPQRNVISWNVMVTAYAKHGLGRKAVQITEYMQLDGVKPDNVTCVGLLNVCTGSADLKLGRKVHGWIAEGRCEADLILWNSLLNMYGRCGEVEQAEMVFDGILQRNVISWTAMLTAYSRQNRQDMALLLFHAIHLSGVKPTCITFLEALDACVGAEALDKGRLVHSCAVQSGNDIDVSLGSALVAMYGRCGSIRDAKACFDDTEVRKNHVTWSAMIAAFVQHGQDREGLQHLRFMQQQGLDMSPATFASTLSACSNLADLREGKRIHSYVRERRFDTEAATVTNSLVTMYGKCGSLDCAREVFETSRRQDTICWNAIISGYAQHSQTRDAVELFHRMQQEGVAPDPVTFVCILSVCSHGGLLDEGVYAYASMVELGLEPTQDNYACVIDLLGRAGKLQEAEEFIQSLGTRPAIETLTSLLSSCKSHGDVQRGRRAAEGIMEMDPRSSSAHVVLSSIYSADPEE
ncbi:pentatricopeptide repeat-containing protein At3g09040, mitochondrial isoform X1 [Selaginella moellendorffii]|uniref:pentatricopeptide repeat-containing protein At3g09040, mitochondrial isoform X1 n=1 Tax=Selaginella moellendorffii TaxID=88036 RepID=UPI000D1CF06B|nr:pentatricopeptide repeat-containing protein At3g09040, mitochondrial isoform X1 [Selaginella moellendorffii]|eukprot:XP_024539233.1 pentatricopeptide repeat-containing protein At3g09040, mitochondrial isoform X1 [Selaginella moellendorffii]